MATENNVIISPADQRELDFLQEDKKLIMPGDEIKFGVHGLRRNEIVKSEPEDDSKLVMPGDVE